MTYISAIVDSTRENIKGIVHPKMEILSSFICPCVVFYDFLSSVESILSSIFWPTHK